MELSEFIPRLKQHEWGSETLITQFEHNPHLLSQLKKIEGFLIDMDGTLYVGPHRLTGAYEWMQAMQSHPYLVLTNNSSADGNRYVDRLNALEMPTDRSKVLTSGDASTQWLADHTEYRSPYVLGPKAARDACLKAGLTPTVYNDKPDCVLLAYDVELTYQKLSEACLLVAQGLPYFATHADRTCIVPEGLLPDAGAMIAAIQTTTGCLPRVLGKPEKPMLDAGLSRLNTTIETTMMIGDQLDTDIMLGHKHSLFSVLVLTGETSQAQLATSIHQPSLVCQHVGELYTVLKILNVL